MAPTAKDLYIEQLSKLKMGTPLYRPGVVQVGDVGFIDPLDGFFQTLYNIETPPSGEPGCPLPIIDLRKKSHPEQSKVHHVCYLSCFILRTLPDFVIILAEEIKEVRIICESSHVRQPVAVHRPITETGSSALKVKRDLYSQKSKMVNAS